MIIKRQHTDQTTQNSKDIKATLETLFSAFTNPKALAIWLPSGDMILETSFKSMKFGTRVMFLFKNIPSGIRLEDNEAGTLLTLEKLASFVE